ncbi:CYTH domain-containing protein [Rossellomorea marisflavi]|uniref:CYTH domain-containing protein n=1 Tax=Rossellomorea marisflavi TaxID=189381 RepID=UPI0034596FC2
MKKWSIALACTVGLLIQGAPPAQAASDITPSYEVKFNVDVDAFPNQTALINAFDATHDEDVKVYYFDTPDQQFKKKGYIHRLRVYDSDKKTNITYKKVFPGIPVEDAIAEADEKGFTNDMSNYKFENDRKDGVDSFSISRKETFKKNNHLSFDSIDVGYAIQLFKDEAPKKVREWDDETWYLNTFTASIPYGPALANTYVGEYKGVEADLEIWSYKGETIAEISTKVDQKQQADDIEQSWLQGLTEADWLNEEQISKTSFVMDR